MKAMTQDQLIERAELALTSLIITRMNEEVVSLTKAVNDEIAQLKATSAELPRVDAIMAAATAQAPDFCQVGTFDVSTQWNEPSKREPEQFIATMLKLEPTARNRSYTEVQLAPYHGVIATEVVKALSAKGLGWGRKYRYCVMAWEDVDAANSQQEG
jgi:hypothetical protein